MSLLRVSISLLSLAVLGASVSVATDSQKVHAVVLDTAGNVESTSLDSETGPDALRHAALERPSDRLRLKSDKVTAGSEAEVYGGAVDSETEVHDKESRMRSPEARQRQRGILDRRQRQKPEVRFYTPQWKDNSYFARFHRWRKSVSTSLMNMVSEAGRYGTTDASSYPSQSTSAKGSVKFAALFYEAACRSYATTWSIKEGEGSVDATEYYAGRCYKPCSQITDQGTNANGRHTVRVGPNACAKTTCDGTFDEYFGGQCMQRCSTINSYEIVNDEVEVQVKDFTRAGRSSTEELYPVRTGFDTCSKTDWTNGQQNAKYDRSMNGELTDSDSSPNGVENVILEPNPSSLCDGDKWFTQESCCVGFNVKKSDAPTTVSKCSKSIDALRAKGWV